jgi:hypothetical protein
MWENTILKEKVYLIKLITFLGLHLKSDPGCKDKLNAIDRKCENPMKIVNCLEHNWLGADPVIL